MATTVGPTAGAPAWFVEAIADEPDVDAVEVDSTTIVHRAWGDPARPGIVLVHGGAAHARWWDPIAPLIAHRHHVVALDLSGHGDSGRRATYPPELWAEEVLAVARARGIDHPVLVGHSMGGFVSIVAAAEHGEELTGAVIVDSPVMRPDPEREEARRGNMFRAPKTYPTLDEAMEHFILVPPQPCDNDFIVEHIARHSLHEVDGGWTWKFDPAIFGRFSPRDPVFSDYLAQVSCRVAVFHGELSAIVTDDVKAHMDEVLGRNAPFVELPQAHHHVFLDQPLAFVAALRALVGEWAHSVRAPSAGGPTSR